ncbi:MAG: TetR/AcrR family transcriptional regulator [Pseudonocardia sp.]
MDQAVRMRAQVLAAAEKCLLESGFGAARLHSAIARRAGLSRPTVYKYVGDQDAIIAAVIQREFEGFLARLRPVLDQELPFDEHLLEVMAFVVGHAREHALLRAALRDAPDRVLPWFTTHAGGLISQVEALVLPGVRRYIAAGELPDTDPRLLVDALCRIALSLVFTEGLFDLSEPAALRAYLAALMPGSRTGPRPVPNGSSMTYHQ